MLDSQAIDARAGHLATRFAAGLFDFSFMGQFEVSGPAARAFLERVQTRTLAPLAPGKLCYTLLLREDGSVFNDATVWCLAPERYWMFTGRPADFDWISQCQLAAEARLERLSGQFSILALQGPRCFDLIETRLPYFGFAKAQVEGERVWMARLGYSGELGVEILVPVEAGAALWERLRNKGARECSFEAANSLRIESGYILFMNELPAMPDPFELGLGKLVTGRGFVGAEALEKKRFAGPRRKLVGLVPTGSTRAPGGLPEALLTSEAYSPVFGWILGMGFAPAEHAAPGNLLRLADGRLAHSARLPFYDPGRLLPRR